MRQFCPSCLRPLAALIALGLVSGCTVTPLPLNGPNPSNGLTTGPIRAIGSIMPSRRGPAAAAPAAEPEPAAQVAATAPVTPPPAAEPPSLVGTRLQTPEIETATKKALELTRRLGESEAERKQLASRVADLEAAGKEKDIALEQARTEIQSARTQMVRAREDLEEWKREITALRDKLRGADEENLQTLQTAVSLMHQILNQSHGDSATSGRSTTE
jgi:outer membrane murein-binding lipoprotein Lpp